MLSNRSTDNNKDNKDKDKNRNNNILWHNQREGLRFFRGVTVDHDRLVESRQKFLGVFSQSKKNQSQSKDRLRRLDMVWLVSTIIQYYSYHYIYMRWNASHPHFRNRAERNWMALPDIRSKYVIVSQAGIKTTGIISSEPRVSIRCSTATPAALSGRPRMPPWLSSSHSSRNRKTPGSM